MCNDLPTAAQVQGADAVALMMKPWGSGVVVIRMYECVGDRTQHLGTATLFHSGDHGLLAAMLQLRGRSSSFSLLIGSAC